MKKLLFLLLMTLFFIPSVNAESFTIQSSDISYYLQNKDILEEQNNILLDYYNTNLKTQYSYYFTIYTTTSNGYSGLGMYVTNYIQMTSGSGKHVEAGRTFTYFDLQFDDILILGLQDNKVITLFDSFSTAHTFFAYYSDDFTILKPFSFLYDSNTNIIYNKNFFLFDTIYITNFYSNSEIILKENEPIPLLKNLLKYDSFNDYTTTNNYTEVNLDNYEYIILNLKDYSKKEAFETIMQVKGMIGITPVYNYGQVEKNDMTDRCNASYSDFTDSRFFVLKNDLINHAVYYVKSCKDGSSFKFDNTIFNITYITTDTVDDPVITVGGVEYNTIPFNKLNTTANSNEENNYIPGESGSSLTDIIDKISDLTSGLWDGFSSFMNLASKFFYSLPAEFQAISIIGFTTLVIIAIIKFLK